MTDIQARLADINARAAPTLDGYSRLIGAINKAITLILTVAAVGVLTVICAGQYEQQLRTDALINQENISRG
jgi:hypothetical protein